MGQTLRRDKIFTCNVGILNECSWEFVPPAGSEITITGFRGSCSSKEDTEIQLIWDYEGANEEPLLTSQSPFDYGRLDIHRFGDGTKKLAIVLKNQTLNAEIMTAILECIEENS